MRFIVALVIVFSFLFPGSLFAADQMIVPAERIGRISLGMTRQQVYGRLGFPNSIEEDRAYGENTNIYWTYNQPCSSESTSGCALTVSWTKSNENYGGVDWIYTDSPLYKTSTGLSVGSKYQDVITTLGLPEMLRPGRRILFVYNSLGIRFGVDEDGKVTSVAVSPKK